MNQQSTTTALAIFACLLWASAFTAVKLGLQYATPIQFAGLRFLISGLILLPFALKKGGFFSYIRNNVSLVIWISLLQTTLQYGLYTVGMKMIPAALAAIMIGSSPLFIAIMSHFWVKNDKLTLRKVLIIIAGLAGLILVNLSKKMSVEATATQLIGVTLLILVSISGGLANIVVARNVGKMPAITLTSSSMIIGGGILYLVSIFAEGFPTQPYPAPFYWSLGYLSLLSAVAITIWFALINQQSISVSNLNFWKFLIPVAGSIIAWIIMPNESPDIFSILGIVIVSVALILLNTSSLRFGRQPNR